ncbi:hypothetical protein SAMN05216232_2246 [Virgibacillus subterraneus]|uniref:Uncharacterized protein n=2 Tax=Virgibacillus TaxID=84406 RepID=A0A1H1E636_9BACI|nr:hypothetical protein SAMN05216231_2742 [Virgibacillus salinus]SEQ38648.1 hypothetical protein SAMN05216232_2246 [Virgibacillus subterraneus]
MSRKLQLAALTVIRKARRLRLGMKKVIIPSSRRRQGDYFFPWLLLTISNTSVANINISSRALSTGITRSTPFIRGFEVAK